MNTRVPVASVKQSVVVEAPIERVPADQSLRTSTKQIVFRKFSKSRFRKS